MYSSNSAQLIQNILSNPVLANQCIDYIENIKPKLTQLLTKIPILEELEKKLDNKEELPNKELPNKEELQEYKELLSKLKLKYVNLKKEYKTVQTENSILQSNLLNKNSTKCIECSNKDNLIFKYQEESNKSCEECNKKNDIIKQFTLHINKPCSLCEEKDRQIHKLFKKNDKICKEKDDQINELKSRCQILEKQAIDSANELARLQSLDMISSEQSIDFPIPSKKLDNPKDSVPSEITKESSPVQSSNIVQTKKVDIVTNDKNLNISATTNQNVLQQLKEQFGNFVKINNSN
jgi:hypothetical protein